MALGIKTKGMEHLTMFKVRVNRQHSLGRITEADRKALVDKVNELMAMVVDLREDSPDVARQERRF